MGTSTFGLEEIASTLRRSESGTPITEICRELGITETMFYRWKRKFIGVSSPELRVLRTLREEN